MYLWTVFKKKKNSFKSFATVIGGLMSSKLGGKGITHKTRYKRLLAVLYFTEISPCCDIKPSQTNAGWKILWSIYFIYDSHSNAGLKPTPGWTKFEIINTENYLANNCIQNKRRHESFFQKYNILFFSLPIF